MLFDDDQKKKEDTVIEDLKKGFEWGKQDAKEENKEKERKEDEDKGLN
jgi:hypothetical protein